jgi:hypothetical protein
MTIRRKNNINKKKLTKCCETKRKRTIVSASFKFVSKEILLNSYINFYAGLLDLYCTWSVVLKGHELINCTDIKAFVGFSYKLTCREIISINVPS